MQSRVGACPHAATTFMRPPTARGLKRRRLGTTEAGRDRVRLDEHRLAHAGEAGLPLAHLPPHTAKRVVYQELDDIARRVELVSKRQLVAVTRRLAGLAGIVAQLFGCEVLVDPADGLIFVPDAG